MDRPLADLSTSDSLSGPPSTRITLLTRLRSPSDAEAWRTFVDLYLPLVFRYCRRRGLQDADARDVSQQVLANIHRAIDTFIYDPQKGKFRNWLGTIATREVTRYQQRDRRPGKGGGDGLGDFVAGQESGEVDAAWQEEFNAHIFVVALERVKAEFDEATWKAFDVTWLHDVKPRQAARDLARPVAWIYKARFRVLERLKGEIEFLTNDAAIFHKPS
jgi:RNA polymerase sigma-70 factor, ECF subfamily